MSLKSNSNNFLSGILVLFATHYLFDIVSKNTTLIHSSGLKKSCDVLKMGKSGMTSC